MSNARPSFLVIRRDNIGDLVCTTPLLRALRERYPQAGICALVNSYNAAVLEGNPDVDEVLTYTKAKHRPPGRGILSIYWERLRLLARLRATGFDFVLVPGQSARRALRLARLVKPRRIIGCFGAENSRARPEMIGIPPTPRPLHEVEDTFRLLAPLGIEGPPPGLTVVADPGEVERARQALERAGLLVPSRKSDPEAQGGKFPGVALSPSPSPQGRGRLGAEGGYSARRGGGEPGPLPQPSLALAQGGRPLIGLHISARKPSQRWPVENFAALAKRLHRGFSASFLLFWSPGDERNPLHPGDDAKAQRILEELTGVPVLAYPSESLRRLIAGLALCDFAICSDGGAMHIAAALGKPILCFFGKSDSTRWHPWGVPYVLLQPESREVTDITIEETVAGFEKLAEMAGRYSEHEERGTANSPWARGELHR